MFFRHERARKTTFDDHLSAARSAGFRTESAGSGRTRIERSAVDCTVACTVEDSGTGEPRFIERAGVLMGKEIGALTDGGFQKFFTTPTGKRKPAQAAELKEIQNFQEDLREALGLTALYNESLGTVSSRYIYDRVEGRDSGHVHKAWD